jgi:hypothetical protein
VLLLRSLSLVYEGELCLSATACAGFGPATIRDAAIMLAPAAKRIVDSATIPSLSNGVVEPGV